MPPVSLTFDNGPTPRITDRLLHVLSARGVPASFFVGGRRRETPGGRRPAERAAAEGHWIGTHGLPHPAPLGRLTDHEVAREIDETEARLAGLAHPDRLFWPFATNGTID